MAVSGDRVAVRANLARRCGGALDGEGCRFCGENEKVQAARSG